MAKYSWTWPKPKPIKDPVPVTPIIGGDPTLTTKTAVYGKPTILTEAGGTKPIIKEYDIKPKDQAFIDFFSKEGLDYTAPQTFAKQLVEAGTYAKSDRKQWWLNALTQAGKSAKAYPDHPASIKYNKLTEEAIRQAGKTTAENLTVGQRQAGQAAGITTQRLNRVKKYENLKNTMLDNNLTLDQAVTSAYKAETGKDIPKATKHDQIIGAFWRIEDTLKNENPKVHKFFENEVEIYKKANQIITDPTKKLKKGDVFLEQTKDGLTNIITFSQVDRAHSVLQHRLIKYKKLVDDGLISPEDYEKLRKPQYLLLNRDNLKHIELENTLDTLLQRKLYFKNEGKLSEVGHVQGQIDKHARAMENFGAESTLWDPSEMKLITFGKRPTKEKLIEIDLKRKERAEKKQNKNEGGLVRPHMSLGGDMAQFTEMESVVPDLNPAEAGMEDYTQLAFSAISKFKNPFKKVDPPPIMSDVASGIKITDKTKKGVKVEGTIKTEGQTPVFHLKSDLELANAAQDKMTPQQWFGYLKKNGVSETELHEFGLGNLLKNVGGWEQIEKIKNGKKVLDKDGNVVMIDKWKNNAPITKADLIASYKNNKPIISYKIQQMEPFEKGWKDFQNFLTGQRSGGSGYLGDMPAGAREFEEMRRLRNKPQDIIGDRLRSNIIKFSQEISDRTGRDIKTAWPELEPQITSTINKLIKDAYGIDDVVENGFGNVKVPFYTQNLVNRFRRLKSGEGFYMGKIGVGHEGAQFLSGGTGYIEIPFTYNPNPKGMRANEPKFTFGEGHFTNPEGNNPVFWLRASERVDERGNRVFLIEEIQSDMHQKVKQKPNTFSYAERMDAPGAVDANILSDRLKTLTVEIEKVSDQIDKITGHTDPSAVTVMERLKVKREALRLEIANTRKRMSVTHTDEVFPEGPWKKSENQAKIAIKTLINLATQEGFDSVALISAKAKNHVVSADPAVAKGNRGFYDNIAVSGMKNVAKNLDLEFSSTNIKDGNGNTWAKIPIINLKKEPVKASVDMYKSEGGFIYRPSFVDVVPVL